MTQPLQAPPTKRVQATFCFVDLAGFTALTEAQGDDDAADVATRFADIARASLGPGDCLIKTIGDAVFIMSPTATSGIALVERMLMRNKKTRLRSQKYRSLSMRKEVKRSRRRTCPTQVFHESKCPTYLLRHPRHL